MPICKNCLSHFSSIVVINGKRRELSNRKYCLTCSPFGQHNTKRLHEPSSGENTQCICNQCGREYQYSRRAGHTHKLCNSCLQLRRRQRIKERAVEYKGGKCVCGYDRCTAAMHFHHIDPKQKEFDISGSANLSWDRIRQELDKCIMLCANCHAEVTWERMPTG